jgi:starch synthase
MFEPGGIVQHEFFLGSTPVIAYSTGGLKDSVIDWDWQSGTGNGFVFKGFGTHDLKQAVSRAVGVFRHAKAYEKLRENARASVLDLKIVTMNWYKEFHRLRRCLVPSPAATFASASATRPTTLASRKAHYAFRLALSEAPSSVALDQATKVCVVGTFCDWNSEKGIELHWDALQQCFIAYAELEPGPHSFKFFVGGSWFCSPSVPTVVDARANTNNVCCPIPPFLDLVSMRDFW